MSDFAKRARERAEQRELVDRDSDLLEEALAREGVEEGARAKLEDMHRQLARRGPLTSRQRDFAEAVRDGRRYDPEPEYANLASTGRAPRGREVELMVRDKPLRPPGRG